MKCHIPGPHVKVFGRTVHAFARFSNELYIEAVPDGLHIRTLNATESAYSIVKFNKSFFSYFKYDHYATDDDDGDGLKCKISMKSALNIFKSPLHMDKQVENLEIRLEPQTCKLIFQLKCKHGVVKTHFVSILDCTILQSVYTKDMVPNSMSTHQRVLSEALSNFHSSDDLVTLEASPQCLILRNYIDTTSDFSKIIRTQINLKPSEFDTYTIGVDTTISFPLKEFKALLAFAEALSLHIQLHFQTTGLPVVFVVQNNTTFEAHFVLATSKPDGSTQSTTQTTIGCREKKRKDTTSVGSATKKQHLEEESITDCLEEDSHLFNFIEMPEANKNCSFNTGTISNGLDRSNVNNCDINFNSFDNNGEDNMMVDDIMPSPTSKNTVKLVFSRCLEATFDLRCIQGTVVADNSDSE